MARPRDPISTTTGGNASSDSSQRPVDSPRTAGVSVFRPRLFYAWKNRLAPSLPALPSRLCSFRVNVDSRPPNGDAVPGRGVEIELPHQVRLRFDSPPEPEWLGRIVAGLAGLPTQGGHP